MRRTSESVGMLDDASMALLSRARRSRPLVAGRNQLFRQQNDVFHEIEGELSETGQSRSDRLHREPGDRGIGQRALDLKKRGGKALALPREQLAKERNG